MPIQGIVEEAGNEGGMNAYQSTLYQTITVPRSFSEGQPWFLAIANGMTVDDAFDLLIRKYKDE